MGHRHDPGRADRQVSSVQAAHADDRDLLISTLLIWLEVSGSAKAAGEALFCHPNTVRYRLRRIEEATGRSLTEPTQSGLRAFVASDAERTPKELKPERE